MKKNYNILIYIIIFILIIAFIKIKQNNNISEKLIEEVIVSDNENDINKYEDLEEVEVPKYHIVTYNQSANTASFLKQINVNCIFDEKVKFIIGTINEENKLEERISFKLECKEGYNTFDIRNERRILKQGEYLFMDISKQGVVYKPENSVLNSLVQDEANMKDSELVFTESDYILPFDYILETINEYNVFVIGNDITIKNDLFGVSATDKEHDYYNLIKENFEKKFPMVNINRINANGWESPVITMHRDEWIRKNLTKEKLLDLDLVIFQLGDKYDFDNSLEDGMTELVELVRMYSPNAKIIWIGNWFEDEENKFTEFPNICKKLDIDYIEIADLNIKKYQSLAEVQTDEKVLKNSSELSILEEVFYPNNDGMKIIADRIIEKVGL